MRRLRQIALASRDLSAGGRALTEHLGIERCHEDPGVGVFGLENALFPVGDQFLEIVAPTRDGTTAGRLLDKRGGDCGYMAIFQVDDLAPVEARLAERGTRIVFDADAGDIRGLHLQPKDVPGAIVSIDAAVHPAEWPWAGPAWRDHVRTSRSRALVGMTVTVPDPVEVARTWGDILGIAPDPSHPHHLVLDDAAVRFVEPADQGREGITRVDVATDDRSLVGAEQEILGVTFRFVPAT